MTAFCECISVADPDLQIKGGGGGEAVIQTLR